MYFPKQKKEKKKDSLRTWKATKIEVTYFPNIVDKISPREKRE